MTKTEENPVDLLLDEACDLENRAYELREKGDVHGAHSYQWSAHHSLKEALALEQQPTAS